MGCVLSRDDFVVGRFETKVFEKGDVSVDQLDPSRHVFQTLKNWGFYFVLPQKIPFLTLKTVSRFHATGHHNCSSAGVHRDAVWGWIPRGVLPWVLGGMEVRKCHRKIHENPKDDWLQQSLWWYKSPGIFWECKMHSSHLMHKEGVPLPCLDWPLEL